MTPVISPWVFYLMPICGNICDFCSIFGILGLFASVFVCLCINSEKADGYDRESSSTLRTLIPVKKILVPATIIMLLLGTFIPTESAITKMLIAQNVTYERVETATNTVESVYNDIMDLFEEEDDNG